MTKHVEVVIDIDFNEDLPPELAQRYEAAQSALNAVSVEVQEYRLSRLTEMPKCPECRSVVDRPKCFHELGSDCPRHEVVAAYGGTDALHRHFKTGCYREDWLERAAELRIATPKHGRTSLINYIDMGIEEITALLVTTYGGEWQVKPQFRKNLYQIMRMAL